LPIAKRAFNNLSWLLVSEVSSKGLTFLGSVYLARVLGKSGFGLFSLALATGVYLWTFVDMGVSVYGTREIARNKEGTAELYSLLTSLRFVLAISSALILCGVIFLTSMALDKKLILMAGGFYVVAYSLSPDWVFRGLEKMQYIAFGNIATALFFLIGIFFLAKGSSDVLWALISYSSSFLIGTTILMAVLYRKFKISFSFRISGAEWLFHIKESFYFAINGALNNILLFIPIFFMGIWSTSEALGTFSAPHRLTILVVNAGGMSVLALYPALSSLYVTDKQAFKNTHVKFQKIIAWGTIPVCVIATAFSKDILVLIYGPSYADSANVFNLLIWLSFLLLIRGSYGSALLSAGFHRFNMIATGIGAITTVLLCIILIPTYSASGAAWALLGGQIVTLALMSGLFRQKVYRSKVLKSHLIKIFFAGIAMGFLIKILHLSVVPSTAIGMLFYVLISLTIGIISLKEIQRVYKSIVNWRIS